MKGTYPVRPESSDDIDTSVPQADDAPIVSKSECDDGNQGTINDRCSWKNANFDLPTLL